MENQNALVRTSVETLMPVFSIDDAAARRNAIVAFVKAAMVEGTDFGKVPGTDKNTLLKPGAEKLTTLFGLTTKYTLVDSEKDWTGANHGGEPFFYFSYSCGLYRGEFLIADSEGSCNSFEKKYRYRWVQESDLAPHIDKSKLKSRGGRISEPVFAIDKAETTGKYGKPAEYWQKFKDAIDKGTATKTKRKTAAGKEMDAWEIDSTVYCIPNDDISDIVNTIQKMAQKRALVAATLLAVNASEFFTQDMEDQIIDVDPIAPKVETAKPKPPTKQEPAHSNHIEDAQVVSENINQAVDETGKSEELIGSLARIAMADLQTISKVFIEENKKKWTPEERHALAEAKDSRKKELEGVPA